MDNIFQQLSSELDLTPFITPINDSKEKEIFLKHYKKKEEYNPQYKYKSPKLNFEEYRKKISRLSPKEQIYKELKEHFLLKVDFLESLKKGDKIPFLFGEPEPDIVDKAKDLINKRKAKKQTRNIDAKTTKTIFKEHLKAFDLNWKIIIRNRLTSNLFVNPTRKEVYIKSRNFSFKEIRTLLCHEIETHVLRSVNGYRQKFKVLGNVGTPNYLETEEGLATVMEDLYYSNNQTRLRFLCARSIAAESAINKPFYKIFKEIKEKYNLGTNNAYVITKRVKRGLKNTSLEGGYIKDHLYFQGREKVIDYLNNGNKLKPLFAGKFGIQDLKYLEKDLKEPKYLPLILQKHPILKHNTSVFE